MAVGRCKMETVGQMRENKFKSAVKAMAGVLWDSAGVLLM